MSILFGCHKSRCSLTTAKNTFFVVFLLHCFILITLEKKISDSIGIIFVYRKNYQKLNRNQLKNNVFVIVIIYSSCANSVSWLKTTNQYKKCIRHVVSKVIYRYRKNHCTWCINRSNKCCAIRGEDVTHLLGIIYENSLWR